MTYPAKQTMPCADENLVEREFNLIDPANGDYACFSCGWMQSSAAAGAAELCRLATWYSMPDYERFAAVARSGGIAVPAAPAHFSSLP